MTLYLADSVNKKIVNQVAVQATTSLDHIMFSEGRLGDQAALAIGDAIEKVFEKEELVRAMRQILQR
jgi:alpha-D-ribose 1-methylphosphonate 5-triphosphate synthase subunit PhnI